jgi:hypothetical protein
MLGIISGDTAAFDTSGEDWGAALYDAATREWNLMSGARPWRGAVLLAELRPRAPLRRGRWVFAHDGTVDDRDYLRERVPPDRLPQWEGYADRELLFAFVLARLDRARANIDAAVASMMTELLERRVLTSTFLLSDGVTLYAHRDGTPLYFAERRSSSPSFVIASQPFTDESWLPIEDKTLLRFARPHRSEVEMAVLRGSDPRLSTTKSDVELPFTD